MGTYITRFEQQIIPSIHPEFSAAVFRKEHLAQWFKFEASIITVREHPPRLGLFLRSVMQYLPRSSPVLLIRGADRHACVQRLDPARGEVI